jgi:TPR repeat protein
LSHKNYVEAARWVTSAAQNGSAFGRGFLGILHMEGKGVTKDYIKAYAWLNTVSDWRMYKEHRDELETNMSQEEIKQAQNLSQKLLKQFGNTIE